MRRAGSSHLSLPRRGLWADPDFVKLWSSQSVSTLGSQVTLLALPLTAALTLDATPAEMGLLAAAQTAPALLLGLFVGVWVDRRRRRPLLIAADLARAGLLALVPAAALGGHLSLPLLYAVAWLNGALNVLDGVAYTSYVPSLLDRGEIVAANSQLQASASTMRIAGPGAAGLLIQLLSAPVAIVADALSFLASAALLGAIRRREAPPAWKPGRRIWHEIGEGLGVVFGNPLLRDPAIYGAVTLVFDSMVLAVFVLFVTRDLGISPGLLGLVYSASSVGFLVGALGAAPLARRFGIGAALLAAHFLCFGGMLVIPFMRGPVELAAAMLLLGRFLYSAGESVFVINEVSLRQTITPPEVQGRVNATIRFLFTGAMPIGALLGGCLGDAIGLRPTMVVSVAGGFLAIALLLWSPIRRLKAVPEA